VALARFANTRDANESEIFDAWRRVGASVYRLDEPCDAIVGYRGKTFLAEIKRPLGPRGGKSHSKLTKAQERFNREWRGSPVQIVRTVDDALNMLSMPIFSKNCHGDGH